MKVRDNPPLHLTYCLNIHPGETWAENFAAIADKACRVREAVEAASCRFSFTRRDAASTTDAPGKPFGLGLRLSSRAADELAEPARLAEFRAFLADRGLYVFTINGFPYGPFHGTAVKEAVYRPDWRTPERRDYTMQLIDILAALLPEGVEGSISTVPVAYKPWIAAEEDRRAAVAMLAQTAVHAARLYHDTGRDICIALEPEPDCYLERMEEAAAFFRDGLRPQAKMIREALGCGGTKAAEVLARHLGVCLDTAHAAVAFEQLTDALDWLRDEGIRLAKVQLSAALWLRPTADALARLRTFADPVYLHQAKLRGHGGPMASFPDLPAAIAAAEALPPEAAGQAVMCVHFHVPLFFAASGDLGSTSGLLDNDFWRRITSPVRPPTQHLEIETYTFGVLPEAIRPPDVVESIRREYEWVLRQLSQAGVR